MNHKKIYIATHTHNQQYPIVSALLGRMGHTIIMNVQVLPSMVDHSISPREFNTLLKQSEALVYDIKRSDVVLLVLPAGRGAHLEAGIAIGLNKPVYILDLNNNPIEPLYSLANDLVNSNLIKTKEDLVRVFTIDQSND